MSTTHLQDDNSRTFKWINGYKYLSNISVDFAILPSFLEVLIYALVADSRE